MKLDYLTKPSFFEDFGFVSKVKMADRVKPEDELFLVGYPYFNVNGTLSLFHLIFVVMGFMNVFLFFLSPVRTNSWLLQPRDACGGRTLYRSCGEHFTQADYFQRGT